MRAGRRFANGTALFPVLTAISFEGERLYRLVMPVASISRREAFMANPALAATVMGIQRSIDPALGQDIADLDEEARRHHLESVAIFEATRDRIDPPAGLSDFAGSIVATGSGRDIDAHFADTGRSMEALCELAGWGTVDLLGVLAGSWLEAGGNRHPPLVAARERLSLLVARSHVGAVRASGAELAATVRSLLAIARFDASMPDIMFACGRSAIVGSLCRYGNLHFEAFGENEMSLLMRLLPAAGFTMIEDGACHDRFATDGAMPGRRFAVE